MCRGKQPRPSPHTCLWSFSSDEPQLGPVAERLLLHYTLIKTWILFGSEWSQSTETQVGMTRRFPLKTYLGSQLNCDVAVGLLLLWSLLQLGEDCCFIMVPAPAKYEAEQSASRADQTALLLAALTGIRSMSGAMHQGIGRYLLSCCTFWS